MTKLLFIAVLISVSSANALEIDKTGTIAGPLYLALSYNQAQTLSQDDQKNVELIRAAKICRVNGYDTVLLDKGGQPLVSTELLHTSIKNLLVIAGDRTVTYGQAPDDDLLPQPNRAKEIAKGVLIGATVIGTFISNGHDYAHLNDNSIFSSVGCVKFKESTSVADPGPSPDMVLRNQISSGDTWNACKTVHYREISLVDKNKSDLERRRQNQNFQSSGVDEVLSIFRVKSAFNLMPEGDLIAFLLKCDEGGIENWLY